MARTISNPVYDWAGTDVSQNRTHNGLNQDAAIAALPGGYDGRGNLANEGQGRRSFSYDTENRLTQVGGSAAMSLEYDPLGRLSKTTASGVVTQYLYDGVNLIAELDGWGNVLRRYIHGGGVDQPLFQFEGAGNAPEATRFLHVDRQGSIIGVSDHTGTSQSVHTYGPYGEPNSWSGPRFAYTGQIRLPEVSLYHYKARAYDPIEGRFLQTDPIGGEDDLNLYAYVGNDPVNKSDPTGTYGRGSGFTDKQWENFNKQQQKVAVAMDKAADKLVAKAAKLDAKGKDGGNELRQTSASLRSGASALRSDGSDGKIANAVDSKTYKEMGGSATGAAFVNGAGGKVMTVNINNKDAWGGDSSTTRWVLGHESLHTAGMSDQLGSNGKKAYKFADEINRDAYDSITGTPKAKQNPDHVMGIVYP